MLLQLTQVEGVRHGRDRHEGSRGRGSSHVGRTGSSGKEAGVVGGGKQALSLRQFESGRHLLLPLGPAVLEPGLDLDLGQVQGLGELQPFGDREVFVSLKRNDMQSDL